MALRTFRTYLTGQQEGVTYKRNQGCQQQDSHQEVLKLLHHQLPQGFPWKRREGGPGPWSSPLHFHHPLHSQLGTFRDPLPVSQRKSVKS